MSRSILLPLLALAAIILFGTTQAARTSAEGPPEPPPRVALDDPAPRVVLDAPVRRAGATRPAPPPAPRLRSETAAPPDAPADSLAPAEDPPLPDVELGGVDGP